MIGRLVGTVAHDEPTGGLMLDVRGVGYELACPVGTTGRAKRKTVDGIECIVIFVHTNLRQDALELFGFSGLEERAAFRQLINVPNVGPRLALSVLNVLPANELVEVIDREDKARLSKVPGVGKKTAERLVLELRGKLPRGEGAQESTPGSIPAPSGDLSGRLVAALTGLGYRQTEAEKAAKSLIDQDTPNDLSALLREALKFLAS